MGFWDNLVVTVYGHNKIVDKIAVSWFDNQEKSYGCSTRDSEVYCATINSLELKDDSWIFARRIVENTQYCLDALLPIKFSSAILDLDDKAIQKVLSTIELNDLAIALRNQNETIKEKIFTNISKNASQTIKENMDNNGPMRLVDVIERQEVILDKIRKLHRSGEIDCSFYK